jgi:hypothetical protein
LPGYSAICERVGSIHTTVARTEGFDGSGRYHDTCTGEPPGTHGAALLQLPSPEMGGWTAGGIASGVATVEGVGDAEALEGVTADGVSAEA